jgi:putative aldouronate transport system permease protein
MLNRTFGEKAFSVINIIILTSLGLVCLLPFWYQLVISLSSVRAVNSREVFLLPVELTLEAYEYVMNRAPFWQSLFITLQRVFIGLPISLFLMITASYPLSKEKSRFKSRSIYVWFFFLTMLFNGGMIPAYLLIVQLNLLNTIWALVLPGSVNVFNMLLLLSFFKNIPSEIEDAALVDGASQWRILWRIYVPISTPVIATVTLFTIVAHWNSWFDGMIYMKQNSYPLQTYLRTIIYSFDFAGLSLAERQQLALISPKGIKAAQMIIGAIPILIVYPFLQRYFVTGITLGSVKS